MSVEKKTTSSKDSGSNMSFSKIIDLISEWEGKIVSYLILAATVQICYELTLRYFFRAPTVWGLDMTIYLCGTTYIMSGAYADRYDAHIRVDVFYSKWKPRTKAFVDLFVTDVLFIFFSSVLAWQAYLWFMESWNENITAGTQWDHPIWPMRFMLLLGGMFLTLAAIGRTARDAKTVLNK